MHVQESAIGNSLVFLIAELRRRDRPTNKLLNCSLGDWDEKSLAIFQNLLDERAKKAIASSESNNFCTGRAVMRRDSLFKDLHFRLLGRHLFQPCDLWAVGLDRLTMLFSNRICWLLKIRVPQPNRIDKGTCKITHPFDA